MTSPQFPDVARRRLLLLAASTLSGIAFSGLSACASRKIAQPITPLRQLAVLPVAYRAEAGPEIDARTDAVPHPMYAGALPYLISAIANSIKENKRLVQIAHYEVVKSINFDPASYVEQRLFTELKQRGVPFVRIEDSQLAEAIRDGDFERLPAGVDAALDVEVKEYTYESSRRAGGYAPAIGISASLYVNPEVQDDFWYYADHRDGGKNTRWLTAPKSMIFPTLQEFAAGTEGARLGLSELTDRLVQLLGQDVKRRVDGLAKLP